MIPTYPWQKKNSRKQDIRELVAVSSKITLHRNLSIFPFPVNATCAQLTAAADQLRKAIEDLPGKWTELDLQHISEEERICLAEEKIIPGSVTVKADSQSIFFSNKKSLFITANIENHYSIHCYCSGNHLPDIWEEISDIDDLLAEKLPIAYHSKFGFLSGNPKYTGTGMKASVLLHLPCFTLAGKVNPLSDALREMNLKLNGFFGDSNDFPGNLYLISNKNTMGESEQMQLKRLGTCIEHIIEEEIQTRDELKSLFPERLADFCSRAAAILRSSHLITTKEAMNALSGLRLAEELEFLKSINKKVNYDTLLLKIQAGQITRSSSGTVSQFERQIKRSEFLRKLMTNFSD